MKPAEMSDIIAWDVDLPKFKGTVYRLKQPTNAMKADFEKLLKQQAMEECITASEGLPASEKEFNRRLVLSDLRNKKFRWGGPYWSEVMQDVATSMSLLMSLMLRDSDDRKVTEARLQEMIQDDDFAPWLFGAVYTVCGMDPTMALAMGKLTIAKAKEDKEQQQQAANQIIAGLQESSLKSSPASGTSMKQ